MLSKKADAIMNLAMDPGIHYIDSAVGYGESVSER